MDNLLTEVSVITVNYNGYEDTCQMIESLERYALGCEVVVVDNASRRDEAGMLKERYPWIVAVRSEENLGFAGGNNLGYAHAKGKYIYLLNNDTVIEESGFEHLVRRLESSPRIGAVSPKIKFEFAPRHIQFAGYTPLSRVTLRNSLIGFDAPDGEQYDTARITPYAHGAAMMLKREVIEKAGLMPELYFLYYEELDWSERIKGAGYEIYYEPLCTVYHKESRSTGQQSPLRVMYLTRNRMLFAWRNLKGADRYMSLLYQVCVAQTKSHIGFWIRGKWSLSRATCQGCFRFFKMKDKLK